MNTQPIAYRYPLHRRVRDRISRAVRDWRMRRLDRLLERLEPDSNYVEHCRRELASWFKDDGPNRWMAEHMVRMLRLFATEGHSGSSAPFAVAVFKELAMFQPWGPLTGVEDEWGEPYEPGGTQQNKRCGHVFRDADGTAYDSQGRIFREPSGACYTSFGSRVLVTFPYTPTREYVDVPAPESSEDSGR